MDRRSAIAIAFGGAAVIGLGTWAAVRRLRRALLPPTSSDPRADLDIREWSFETADGERRAVVLVPKPLVAGARLPLLIALHGRGEATDPRTGAHAWLDTYRLDVAYRALRTPPLDRAKTLGLERKERLDELDASLAERPFGGLVVACPSIDVDVRYDRYAKFLADQLIPRLRAETPIVGTARTTGIDGVSLGGIAALRIGAAHPELFYAIGGMQPAILETRPASGGSAIVDTASEPPIVDVLTRDAAGRPLRLLTTDDDGYKPQVLATSKALAARNVPHTLVVTGGAHDVTFLRAVAGLELLHFHDRVLRA